MTTPGTAAGRPFALPGGVLVALTLAALALHLPGAGTVGSDTRKIVFVCLLIVAAAVYLAAVRFVLRRPARPGAIWIVLAIAVAMRLPPLLAPPFLSSDVYRYVWDGRVQLAGFNPYRFVPAAPELAALRDETIYPHISRADYAPTIYPPTAQIVFQAVAWISQSVYAMKAVMVAFEAIAIGAVLAMLRLARLPPERVLIYAWNPLAVWAFAGNGHADAIGIGLLAVALLLRGLRRDTLAGALLGMAILVKFLPARRGAGAVAARRRMARLSRLRCGDPWPLSLLPGRREPRARLPSRLRRRGESLQGGGIWLLAGLGTIMTPIPLAAKLYIAVAAIGLAALGAWIAFQPRPPAAPSQDIVRVCGNAAVLAACITVTISPHYPWYFAWLAMPCCLCARWSVLWLSVAPVLLYLDPWHERFLWPSLVYVPAALLAACDLWRRLTIRRASRTDLTEGAS